MQVKTAPNGWPGMFIPGDEALGMASHMAKLADALENGSIQVADAAAFLRNTAAELAACNCDSRKTQRLNWTLSELQALCERRQPVVFNDDEGRRYILHRDDLTPTPFQSVSA